MATSTSFFVMTAKAEMYSFQPTFVSLHLAVVAPLEPRISGRDGFVQRFKVTHD